MTRAATPTAARPRGRPREFDRDKALRVAMLLFWRHGYEGTSMNQLVEAMGITSTSIYAAFGSKERLFEEATDLYLRTEGGAAWHALHEHADAREAIAAMLQAAVAMITTREQPSGCLLVLWGAGETPTGAAVRRRRGKLRDAIWARLERGRADGDLAEGADIDVLARLFITFLDGLSIEASDGASAGQLVAAVDQLMTVWPARRIAEPGTLPRSAGDRPDPQ